MRVLAISGSLRSGAHSTALLRALREAAPAGIDVDSGTVSGRSRRTTTTTTSFPGRSRSRSFASCVREADAVFFATPEYNSSVPGALKNALDWASRPLATNAFRNKPVAVISSSAGAFGGVWAAAELRKVLAAMGARVTDAELSVGHVGDKFEDGQLVDDDVRQGLRDALQTLVAEVPSAIAA